MRRFNPNAYGNPQVKSQQHERSSSEANQPGRPQNQASGDVTTEEEMKFPAPASADSSLPVADSALTPDRSQDCTSEQDHTQKQSQALMNSKFASRPGTPQNQILKHATRSWSRPSADTIAGKSSILGSANPKKFHVEDPDEVSYDDHLESQQPEKEIATALVAADEFTPLKEIDAIISDKQTDCAPVYVSARTELNTIRSGKMTRSIRETPARESGTVSHGDQDCPPIDEAMLGQAVSASLKSISRRNKGKEKTITTSLRDLDLARKPTYLPYPDNSSGTPQPTASIASFTQPPHAGTKTQSVAFKKRFEKGKNFDRESHTQSQDRITQGDTWTSKPDLKPIDSDAVSNTYKSSAPSNLSQASKDSIQPFHSGRRVLQRASERPHPLAGWDGIIQPPPDWVERSHFYEDNPDLHYQCDRWTHEVETSANQGHDRRFTPVQSDTLNDISRHPDGISMVPRDTVIGKVNASRYGYEGKEAQDVLRFTQPMAMNDFEDWGKLDLNRPENVGIKHETTEELVQNWVKHKEERHKKIEAEMEHQYQAAETKADVKALPNPSRPLINIYLRPALKPDLSQMTEIYNWYIENSSRPAETSLIEQEDMQGRFDDVQSSKLPFIVAIQRSTKAAVPYDIEAEIEAIRTSPHPIKNMDPGHKPMMAMERVVGWACAQHFTAGDYVEHISAELEVYVDPQYRQLGVGRCLMDKLIEACDRGYMSRGGYHFYCPPEYRHLYTSGGGCDLHKLVFIFRKWKYPRVTSVRPVTRRHAKANIDQKIEDQENDYEVWMRRWLESWEFEVEGMLKGAGAKNRRFIDVVHFSRETRWQPAEGRIPEPFPAMF